MLVGLHITLVWATLLAVFYTDKIALAWLLGKKETLDDKNMTRLHYAIWVGLLGIIISGAFLAYPRITYFIHDMPFIIKMLFVLALLVNAVFLGRLMKTSFKMPFKQVDKERKIEFFIGGMVSTFSWIGALVMALFI